VKAIVFGIWKMDNLEKCFFLWILVHNM